MDTIKNISFSGILIGFALILPEITFIGIDLSGASTESIAVIQLSIILLALGYIYRGVLNNE